jgi:hypothetical protein
MAAKLADILPKAIGQTDLGRNRPSAFAPTSKRAPVADSVRIDDLPEKNSIIGETAKLGEFHGEPL